MAIFITERRWVARGGNRDDVGATALVAVPAGIVGARIYHVITDHQLYRDDPLRALAVWDGGLGIWGGVAAGVLAGVIYARHRKLAARELMDAAAPALVIAQAIGRIGNYFNQELFGRPTGLPWALRVDPQYRPERLGEFATFHPLFLYEGLGNLLIGLGLIWVSRRYRWTPGRLFALYVAAYCTLRVILEQLRVDPAKTWLDLRVNTFTAGAILAVAAIWFWRLRGQPGGEAEGRT